MDAILTGWHLGSRIKRCILINVIVPKLDCAGEVQHLGAVQMTTAEKILTCSSTTSISSTVFRAELGKCLLKATET